MSAISVGMVPKSPAFTNVLEAQMTPINTNTKKNEKEKLAKKRAT